ncbi:MAG: phytanoyl-CoA dioxygenase family protein [Hyphomicrobiales bacterium]|nr:phytanoyl-CoA dioxygenase family protein [Hyphomicrobiales bacterium]MBV8823458.1 phytanoyl-CoA dioxygenase family protein [Hyphomicrobiales bacterium]
MSVAAIARASGETKSSRPRYDVARIISTIRERGFCVVPNLIPGRRCDALGAALRRLLREEEQVNRRPNGHQRVLHLAAKHARFVDLVTHPLVLSVWRGYLGDDMLCSSLTANALWPGCSEQYWHVDHPYWTMAQPYPVDLPLATQTIWMLDDFTVENGATAGIAGSHRRPHLPSIGAAWTEEGTIFTGRRGSAVLMDGALWHTSRPNLTEAMRCGVLVKYIRSFCVTQEDMRLQLAAIKRPSKTVEQLFGAHQYVPTRSFPY